MKNKGIIFVILGILILFFNLFQPVCAGVGNTESGGGVTTGGDGGSGFFDSPSDGFSSGFSSGSSSSSSASASNGDGDLSDIVFLLIIFYVLKKVGDGGKIEPENDEKAIETIKLVHPDFDEYDLISYTKGSHLEL